jgi:hypothetical protein
MGVKGDRAIKEPLAIDLYADGRSMPEISRKLDISDTTLRRWKAESRVPGEKQDGWDKRRAQKRNYVQRARDLLDDQYDYVEGLLPEDRDSRVMDSLSKMFAIVERSEKRQKQIRYQAIQEAAETAGETAKQSGVSSETIKAIRRDVLRMAE